MSNGRRLPAARIAAASALVLGVAAAAGIGTGPSGAGAAPPAAPPNIVVVLTDDQTLAEMAALPQTQALIGNQGIAFDRAYASYPLCCPARATLLSGQHMHNHQVRGNHAPFGGWERFAGLGTEAKALPVWLQEAGYHTVQIGKYLNGYPNLDPPVPPGWDEWYGKLSEYNPGLFGNQVYFNYNLLERDDAGSPAKVVGYGQSASDYQTDVLRDKAVDAIERLAGPGAPDEPFFLDLWFSAPHAPYISATRHVGAYGGTPVRRSHGFNEKDVSDKPKFIRRLPRLNRRKVRNISQRQRDRWAQLLAVDEAVAAIVAALSREGELDETYIVFTSDNGYFSGEHRVPQGKYLPYEEAAHVPLLMRGPEIPPGSRSTELVSNVDLAPTLAAIAEAEPQLTVDGRSLLPYAMSPAFSSTRPLLLEGDTGTNLTGGEAVDADSAAKARLSRAASGSLKRKAGVRDLEQEPVAHAARRVRAPAYRAIRTSRYLFVRYGGRGAELYDMLTDPRQLRSRHADRRYRFVKQWLQAQLAALEYCGGPACSTEIGADPVPLRRAPRAKKPRRRR